MGEEIKAIKAIWRPSESKTEVYRLLNMAHSMAGQLAQNNQSTWRLARTATYPNYVLTVWTNGIVDLRAETQKGYKGEVISHYYSLKQCEEEQ